MSSFTFQTAKKVLCAPGALNDVGKLCRSSNVSKIMVITDPGLIRTGIPDRLHKQLNSTEGIKYAYVYSDVQADPLESSVQRAVTFAKENDIDGVIGIGGGSSMDVAKVVALLHSSKDKLPDIYGINLATGPRLPLFQIPTTAGTGSEVTPISILTTETHEKKGIVSDLLFPDYAILDAELTVGLPANITAMTGIDAMVHAIEAYTSKLKKNPISDALALQALKLLYSSISIAVQQGENIEARNKMLQGSLLAGMAFANAPVGGVHALAYPVGAKFHVPHGLSNSLMLNAVLEYNAHDPIAAIQYGELADAMMNSHHKSAATFISVMQELVEYMPIPQSLREVGIKEKDLTTLAMDAVNIQRLLVNNPREIKYNDALALYAESL